MSAATFPPALAHLAHQRIWIGWYWGPVMVRDKATGIKVPKIGADGRPKLTKVPCDIGGNNISFKDPAQWRTWEEIRRGIVGGSRMVGAGIAAAANDGSWIIMDLDHCRDPQTGAVQPWAWGIVESARSYTEVSPSGTGLRIIGGSGGWDRSERSRLWDLGDDVRRAGVKASGETFFSIMYATVTFATLAGFESLWNPDLGALAATLPKRKDGEGDDGGSGPGGVGPEHGYIGDPTAPVDVVRETLEFIPNGDNNGWKSWRWWNLIGMRVFAATNGSDEGLEAWDEWSAQHPAYGDEDTCENRWEHWRSSSPPNSTGFAPLLTAARDVQARLGVEGWTGGPVWRAYYAGKLRDEAVAAMGHVPEEATMAIPYGGGTGTDANVNATWERPTIVASGTDLHLLVDAAESALIAAGDMAGPVLQRGVSLVVPTLRETYTFAEEKTLAAQFVDLKPAGMMDILSKAARWMKMDGRKGSLVFCDPPPKVCEALLNRHGRWRLPSGVAIATLPIFRPDGTLAAKAGYDAETRTYLMPDPSLDFGRMAARVDMAGSDRRAALAALDMLDGLLGEFPFVENSDRSVALSAMLTPPCRGALDVVPLHAFNAPDASSGKTFLAGLCASLTLGRPPHVFAKGESEAELEKRIGTVLMAGMPIATIDNVNGTLDGSFLCIAVEQRLISVRVLGESRHVELANGTCFFATGNNITPVNDTLRRVLMCTLDPNMERPEQRRFSGDPRARMLAAREDFLVAALTVIMAHARAGFPGEAMAAHPLASYGRWGRYVRGALLWLGRADPVDTMERSRKLDPDKADLRDCVDLMVERQRIWGRTGWTVSELISLSMGMGAVAGIEASERFARTPEDIANQAALKEWLVRIGGDKRGAIDPVKVGHWLRRHAGRVSGALKLERHQQSKGESKAKWQIATTLLDVNAVSKNA